MYSTTQHHLCTPGMRQMNLKAKSVGLNGVASFGMSDGGIRRREIRVVFADSAIKILSLVSIDSWALVLNFLWSGADPRGKTILPRRVSGARAMRNEGS